MSSDSGLMTRGSFWPWRTSSGRRILLGVEERRDRLEHLAVLGRVADLLVERLPLGLPVGRDALQRAQPVRDAEDVDADGELLGLEGQRRQDHVAAVAAADDADPVGVDVRAGSARYALGLDAVAQRLAAVLAVVGGEERLAVARAAAVVDARARRSRG